MVKIGKYGPVIECVANEGNVTVSDANLLGGDMQVPILASGIKEGDPVKLSGYDTTDDAPIVTKCSAGDKAIGYAANSPRWEIEPTMSASYGSYKSRKVSIEFRCQCIETVTVEAANSAISVGDSIAEGSTTVGRFDKAGSTTTDKALAPATASSGAKIDVAFGVY